MKARFEVLRELGSGGEGRVLAVSDRARGGVVLALKETHGPRAAALRDEFELLQRLCHPVLVPVFDWFDASPLGGDVAAYTQAWVEGRELGAAAPELDTTAREAVMLGLLGALAHLHAAGVAHLDLKPDNVLVDAHGAPFLVDFGIAARLGTRPEVVRGSRSYVAPELLAGAPVAPSADLWAFGRMLTELEVMPSVAALLAEADPARRPASAIAVARAWSSSKQRPIELFPASSAPALVRSGGRVGHVAELARARSMRVVLVAGPDGAGRRTFVSALAQAHVALGPVERWPLTADVGVPGFIEALGRLAPEVAWPAPPAAPLPRPSDIGADAAWQPALVAWARSVVELLLDSGASGLLGVLEPEPPRVVRAVLDALVEGIASGRGEVRLAWARGPGLDAASLDHVIALPPFGRDDARAFVASRFGRGPAADDRLVHALVAASGGRPGHMEALAELLVARGALRFDEGGWLVQPSEASRELPPDLPHDLGRALAARVELLEPELGRTLAALGCLRFPVRVDSVAALLDEAPALVVQRLRELAATGLARGLATGLWTIAHAALARSLAEARELSVEARARVLADVDLDARVRALLEAGALGARRAAAWASDVLATAPEAAEEAAELALELEPRDVEALRVRAEVANLLGPREVQRRVLERLVAELGEDPRGLDAQAQLFWTLTRMGDAAQTLVAGPALAARAEAAGRPRLAAEVLVHVAIAATQRGDQDASEAHLEAASALVAARGLDPETLPLRARIANNLGNVHAYRGRHEQALEAYRTARHFKIEEGDPVGERIATGNLGLTLMQLGRFADAREHLMASLALARRTGHRRGEAWSWLTLAELGLDGAAWGYALRLAERAGDIALALGDTLVAGDAYVTAAEAHLQLGAFDRARAAAEAGRSRAASAENTFTAARAELVLVLCDARDRDEAIDPERLAPLIDNQRADAGTRRGAALVLARSHLGAGRLDQARAVIARALDDGTRTDLRWIALADLDTSLAAGGAAHRRSDLVRRFERFLAAWPAVPAPDPDGPCQASVRQDATVRRLAERVRGMARGVALSSLPMDSAGSMPLESLGQLEQALGAGLQHAISATAAERGFLVVFTDAERPDLASDAATPATRILVARDADGEAIADAARRLPEAAILGLAANPTREASGAAWRGADGRGATLALPWRVAVGSGTQRGALVLQNRFVADAFEHLAPAATALSALLTPLRLLALEQALAEVRHALGVARADAKASEKRTTEEIRTLRKELETTREQLGPAREYPEIIFKSGAMKKMLRQVDRVLSTDLPINIHGESGTGKELVARAIHHLGPRAKGPFVAQNCTAIPPTLFESELFGHERGAFTGAHRATEGLFRRAHGGTLFLDEIGDLPLELQAKLLRVLETGEVRPVGATRSITVDVRIVSATHRDLAELISKGTFREDLYYRLNVIRIDVPPLRERPDDIPVLIEHFLARRAAASDGGALAQLDDAALRACLRYPWPGNVRQLENEITRAALLADSGLVRLSDLSVDVQNGGPPRAASAASASAVEPQGRAIAAGSDPLHALGLDEGPLKDRIARLESIVLEAALTRARHNKSEVARDLGLSRAGLNLKLKRLGLWGGDDDGDDAS